MFIMVGVKAFWVLGKDELCRVFNCSTLLLGWEAAGIYTMAFHLTIAKTEGYLQ